MESIDIRKIWNSAKIVDSYGKVYSTDDIRDYRNKKLKETSRSSRWSILFDIGFKCFVILEMFYLLIFLNGQIGYKYAIVIMLIINILFILKNTQLLKQFNQIKETDSVIENLSKKLDFIKTLKSGFVIISSLSNLFFVLISSFLYFYFKYDEIRLSSPLEDPIIYLFPLAAFAITFFSMQPVYKRQIRELNESMEDIDDMEMVKIRIEEAKKLRKLSLLIYSLLLLTGILLLIFIFIYLKA